MLRWRADASALLAAVGSMQLTPLVIATDLERHAQISQHCTWSESPVKGHLEPSLYWAEFVLARSRRTAVDIGRCHLQTDLKAATIEETGYRRKSQMLLLDERSKSCETSSRQQYLA